MRAWKPYIFLLITFVGSSLFGQQTFGSSGTPANAISVPVSFGEINANGGNLHLEIPVVSKPVRGAVPFVAKLVYDSSTIYANGFGAWVPATGTNVYGGWTLKTSADPMVAHGGPRNTTFCYDNHGHPLAANVSSDYYFIYDQNGTYHRFPIHVQWVSCVGSQQTYLTSFSGGAWADDGSGYYLQETLTPTSDSQAVWNRSGVQVYPFVQDTNGNSFSVAANGDVTDPTGATPLLITTPSGSEVDYKYYDSSSPGSQSLVKVTLQDIPVCTDFADGMTPYCNNTLKVISNIAFASGETVSFSYSTNGGLNKITLPQGGFDQLTQAKLKYSGRTLNGSSWGISGSNPLTIQSPSGKSVITTTNLAGANWTTNIFNYNPDNSLAATTVTSYTSSCTGGGVGCVRPTQTVITPAGGAATTTQYGYDAYYNVNSVKTWDYGVQATGSTWLSDVETTYATLVNTHIVDRPSTVTVFGNTGWGTNGQAAKTQYTYDGATGNVQTVGRWNNTSGTFHTTTITPGTYGNPSSIQDPRGNLTTLGYDCSGSYVSSVTLPSTGVSHSASVSHDCYTGLALTSTADNSVVTSYSYDTSNRLIDQSSLAGHESIDYPTSYLVEVRTYKDANSYVLSQAVLDSFGRNQTSGVLLDGAWLRSDNCFDGGERVRFASAAYTSSNMQISPPCSGAGTSYSYDGLNRITSQTNSDSSTKSSSFVGACATVLDEAGHGRKLCNNALGQLTSVVEPDASSGSWSSGATTTTYVNDVLGNITSVSQGSGASARLRSFVYDSLSRIVSESNPESGITCYGTLSGATCSESYDENGNLLKLTDARNVVTTFSNYDALNRPTGITYSDGTAGVTLSYDQTSVWGNSLGSYTNGRLTQVSKGSVKSAFKYDAAGNVLSQWDCLPSVSNCTGGAYQTQATYDFLSLKSITYPSSRVVAYSTDIAARLSTINLTWFNPYGSGYQYAGFTYGSNGLDTTITYGNGLTETNTYNSRGQLNVYSVAKGTQVFLKKTIGYGTNNNGNILSVADSFASATDTYGYDYLNRVTSGFSGQASGPNAWGQTFSYDAWGNLLKQHLTQGSGPDTSWTANVKNQLDGVTYDLAGHITNDVTNSYAWDATDRLTAANGMTYTDNAFHERVRKETSSSVYTEYVYFGGKVLAERTQDGDWSDYIFAGSKRIAKADSFEHGIKISGHEYCNSTSTPSCTPNNWFRINDANYLSGYTIATGDKLYVRQWQDSARGGMALFFQDGTNNAWYSIDQNGFAINDDPNQSTWDNRTIDLSSSAGKKIDWIGVGSDQNTPVGDWDIVFGDISIVSADGTVHSIYSGSPTFNVTWQWSLGSTGAMVSDRHLTGVGWYYPTTTLYSHGDQIGSARMITSAGGWPDWQGTYTPFGYEVNKQSVPTHFKYADYEKDDETGQFHTDFRQMSPAMGRWLSPDPLGLGAVDPSNPQSWNRYAYVGNSPMNYFDPFGLQPPQCSDTTYASSHAECSAAGGTGMGGSGGMGSMGGQNGSMGGYPVGYSNLILCDKWWGGSAGPAEGGHFTGCTYVVFDLLNLQITKVGGGGGTTKTISQGDRQFWKDYCGQKANQAALEKLLPGITKGNYVPTINKMSAEVGAHVALEGAAASHGLKFAIRARTGVAMSTSSKILGGITWTLLLFSGYEALHAAQEEYKACSDWERLNEPEVPVVRAIP